MSTPTILLLVAAGCFLLKAFSVNLVIANRSIDFMNLGFMFATLSLVIS